jgi:hypothetical protein
MKRTPQNENKLPDGFRYVEDNEVLPNGDYETRLDLGGKNITNAPKIEDKETVKEEIKEEVKEKKEETVNVDTDKIKKDDDEPIKIKIKSGGIAGLKKFVGTDTKIHELAEDREDGEDESEDDGKVLIGEHISEGEYELIASVLIILIDTVIINIFKFWSGDTKDSSYGLSKPKRKELTVILGQILKKHEVKWSLELLFVFMLVLGYAQSAKNAYESRKELKEKQSKIPRKIIVEDEDGKKQVVEETVLEKDVRGAKPTVDDKVRTKLTRSFPKTTKKKAELYNNATEVED